MTNVAFLVGCTCYYCSGIIYLPVMFTPFQISSNVSLHHRGVEDVLLQLNNHLFAIFPADFLTQKTVQNFTNVTMGVTKRWSVGAVTVTAYSILSCRDVFQ